MERGRIAGPYAPFYAVEVRELRDKVSSLAGRWIYITLKTSFHVEEVWDKDVRWVWGIVPTTKIEVQKRSRITGGNFFLAWEQLIDSGFVREEQGQIIITHYKLKGYDAVSPLEIREWFARIHAIEKIHEAELDDSEEEPENADQMAKIIENSENAPPSEGGISPSEGGITPSEGGAHLLMGLKERRSLSHMYIVSGFYRGIGQKRISKSKRERATLVSKNLKKDGFSLEDIAYAVDWILENTEDVLYDFSIVEHIIGQAIADRDKRAQNEKENADREKAAADEKAATEKEERDREVVEGYKKNLSEEERDKLFDYAEDLLRAAGEYKESFIDPFTVGLKENEIIRDILSENGPQSVAAHIEDQGHETKQS